ncbi:MAG: pseudouridine-5'-phosphate glycosidase [Anaerolineae bacterium]|nr:pseudouridine-5'-phosphate glycosidase [Anaerolineae bacterium]
MNNFTLNPDIQSALDEARPIVALESALITHGFAYPANVDITLQMAGAIRERGAVPAVIAIWDGRPTIGLSAAQIETLAADKAACKVSVRDLPLTRVRGGHGGTTVAATALLAHRAGIRVFATGGIGGVHRGHPEDVSADLPVLAQTPIIVVCAGAKSILDLPRTLEYLETHGVPVLGWRSDEFPAFYSRSSGLSVDMRVENAAQVVQIFAAQRALRLPQGVLVTAPIPADDEVPTADIEPLIQRAVAEADAQGIAGKALTPFILARMVELSEARTRHANESLLVNNASVAAEIAAEGVRSKE